MGKFYFLLFVVYNKSLQDITVSKVLFSLYYSFSHMFIEWWYLSASWWDSMTASSWGFRRTVSNLALWHDVNNAELILLPLLVEHQWCEALSDALRYSDDLDTQSLPSWAHNSVLEIEALVWWTYLGAFQNCIRIISDFMKCEAEKLRVVNFIS